MLIKIAPLAAAALLAAPAAFATTYKTDQGHTEVQFSWSHAGVSVQSGEFTQAEGTLEIDPENPEAASLNVTIKADSLATGFGPLDDHISSADFLEVATYPEITFVSTSVEKTGDNTANVSGDLTIHGTTKPVVLETTMTHFGPHPLGGAIEYYQGDWAAFEASTTIDHQAFGVGGFSTGPITIRISTEMRAQ
ncbi:YceI family protein (plasmid) [Leisingera sp. M527]|uniref:YceI family protein n=1 Tax=unclassified Leisingera TaxID=2614906 RepID=UPI0021A87F92|nr:MULTISPECIES: YceI family protein [unclassified Leisingera]UWQ35513.1 YceI family protein [Leisingera sp. M527]UWQ77190.1 YceI family protein [Leisingera sp. M658]